MKNDKVQILRAAAIMAVIIIHTCPSSMEVWVRPFVNFAVAMFLFLSASLAAIVISDKILGKRLSTWLGLR